MQGGNVENVPVISFQEGFRRCLNVGGEWKQRVAGYPHIPVNLSWGDLGTFYTLVEGEGRRAGGQEGKGPEMRTLGMETSAGSTANPSCTFREVTVPL